MTGSRRHVLISGINYWPEHTGVAPYTTGLAEHLSSGGHRVTVLTGVPHYPSWTIPTAYRWRIRSRERIRGVEVLRFRHHVPRTQSVIRRGLYEATWLANAMPGFRCDRPDLILGIVPALASGVAAALLSRRLRVPYAVLFQDLMGSAATQSGIRGGGLAAGLAKRLEGRLSRGALAIGVVAESFREYLSELGVPPDRITHLPNWSHISLPAENREAIRQELGWVPDLQVVLHAGNMGLKQGLENVIEAARRSGSGIRFVLMGDGSQRRKLEALARGCPNVTFLAPQPEERIADVLAAADVLLVNERASVVNMSLPSKLTSYFVAGRPVLAAVPSGGATHHEVERSGAGLVVPPGDPEALLEALQRMRDPEPARRLAAAGRAYARNHLSAPAALKRWDQFLERVGSHRPFENERSAANRDGRMIRSRA